MLATRDGYSEGALARGGLVLLTGSLTLAAVLGLVLQPDPGFGGVRRGAGVGLAVLCTAMFFGVEIALTQQRWLPRLPIIALSAACSAVVLFVFFDSWTMLGVGLAAIGLGFRPPRSAIPAFLLGLGCHALLMTRTEEFDPRVGIPLVNWVTAIVLYSMTRLVVVLQELRRTREHLARLQVDEERTRISRDLHDIIGRTLVAVSLRTETAIRLINVDVVKCRAQLEQLQASIAAGQSQLRALTSGPVIIGLSNELATARRLFTRLGVRVEIESVPVDERDVEQTLAAVVRESVTNCLKHSRPRECRIILRRESLATVLSVVNDGLGPALDTTPGLGTGLPDLRARVDALGGTFTSGRVEGQQFRVIARIPHRVAAAGSGRPAGAESGSDAVLGMGQAAGQ